MGNGTLLTIVKVYTDGQVVSSEMQMKDAAACQSAKKAMQNIYDGMTAKGWPAIATVECM